MHLVCVSISFCMEYFASSILIVQLTVVVCEGKMKNRITVHVLGTATNGSKIDGDPHVGAGASYLLLRRWLGLDEE